MQSAAGTRAPLAAVPAAQCRPSTQRRATRPLHAAAPSAPEAQGEEQSKPLRVSMVRCAAAAAAASAVQPLPLAPPAHATTPRHRHLNLHSLGCPKNTVDGEVLLGDLFRSGFEITDAHDEADAIVVNTCGFVEDAKDESIEVCVAVLGSG